MLTLAHRLVHSEQALVAPTGEELVIVKIDDEHYFGLDAVGREVWERIGERLTLSEVCDAVQAEFDVSRGQVEADVLKLARELMRRGLVVPA